MVEARTSRKGKWLSAYKYIQIEAEDFVCKTTYGEEDIPAIQWRYSCSAPFDLYKPRWTFLRSMPTAEDFNMLNISDPMLVVALHGGLGAGTKVFSIYPPVARYYHRPVAELPHKGVLCQSTGNK
jgi:hypothetical protein